MPWKDGYTISDEKTLNDADLRWPEGSRCCFLVTVDLSVAKTAEGIREADLASPVGYFGLHDGLDGVLDVLSRHGVRSTFAVPGVIAELHPQRVRAIAAAGHEIAAHGFAHEDVSALEIADERERLAAATEILTRVAGTRPAGWFSLPRQGDAFAGGTISAHSVDLALDAGYDYFGNGLADDIPHWWVTDFTTRRAMLTLPYYYHFDDQWFLDFPAKGTGLDHADSLDRNWRAEFAAQYRRGRCFSMTLHPRLVGWAHRLALLDRFLAHVRSFPDVWTPTGAKCAQYWRETYPPETHLRLSPSIWQDIPGSLS
jgi:peptidoglycan/xylan/chitin deacetylase (PgdA/CDA1 family)